MRLELGLSPPTEALPFDYVNELIGRFHRWVGPDNDLHERISLYSLGWLRGGEVQDGRLAFPKGTVWPLSFHDKELARRLIDLIQQDPSLPYGMEVRKLRLLRPPDSSRFLAQSPVLVRQPQEDRPDDHLRFDDPDAGAALTRTLHSKMKAAGLPPKGTMRFAPSPRSRTKLVRIGEQKYKANLCPITVEGDAETRSFVWSVGAGALTGCGFGALDPLND